MSGKGPAPALKGTAAARGSRQKPPEKPAETPVSLHIYGGVSAELVCIVQADSGWTVRDVKVHIERGEGTLWEAQRLLLGSRLLPNEGRLGELVPPGSATLDVAFLRDDPQRGTRMRMLREGRMEYHELRGEERGDREMIFAALQFDGAALEHVPEELREDRDIMLAAVKRCGAALQWATPVGQSDREVVLAAVRQYGDALKHASIELKADPEVVLSAVRNDPHSLRFGADALRDDRGFLLRALQLGGKVFRHASSRWQSDREMLLIASKSYPDAYTFASPDLGGDKECVLAVVHANGPMGLRFARPELRADPEVKAAALRDHPTRDFSYHF